jgi:chemotaxis family two-component system sensor histidine kinase/response regulator PixL
MSKELEIRRQFLDEAQEYLEALDTAVIGLSDGRVDLQRLNSALRAAHSIKGGAGMMGFHLLSQSAHRCGVRKSTPQKYQLPADHHPLSPTRSTH